MNEEEQNLVDAAAELLALWDCKLQHQKDCSELQRKFMVARREKDQVAQDEYAKKMQEAATKAFDFTDSFGWLRIALREYRKAAIDKEFSQ